MNVGRVTALLAAGGCLAGWALLAYFALGPTYRRCGEGPRGDLGCRSASMLELHGIPTSFFVLATAFGLAAVAGMLVWRGYPVGRWLMVAACLPLVVLGAVSGLLLPITCLIVLATMTAFASQDG